MLLQADISVMKKKPWIIKVDQTESDSCAAVECVIYNRNVCVYSTRDVLLRGQEVEERIWYMVAL